MSIITRKEAVEIRMKNYLDDEMLNEMVNMEIKQSLDYAENFVQIPIPYFNTNMSIIKKLLKRIRKSGYSPVMFLGELKNPDEDYILVDHSLLTGTDDEKKLYYVIEFFID